ncbi:hypothetical protein KXD40_007927 [Peronospora effusa]|uniref:AMP-dependent synthetase/ligase domain-containing protein n=1 Tax=Peronospora effusa TaxID=542832 RepID=A0A3R7WNM5_9STRA|nr:hypothetical protein DD237_007657 [Peronospora effusa]UIZ23532.1 hypothetical protein KXD40_007927 [Peronospora effusa]
MLPFSSDLKGVGLSAKNLLPNAMQVSHVELDGKIFLGLVPFFHIHGMMLSHLSILQQIVMLFCRYLCLTHFSTRWLLVASGDAPIGKLVTSLVHKRLGLYVKQIYGMTELSPAVNCFIDYTREPLIDRANCGKLESVGCLVPNTELRVCCTTTGRSLPANREGELLYRRPQVLGYENNHEATRIFSLRSDFFYEPVLIDIGYIDEDGFVFVIDRAKELIKYKNYQVALRGLEDVLNHHPAVTDCCCVRGQNTIGEDILKAFVMLKYLNNPDCPTP